MKVSIIAAVAENGVIGCKDTNSMPWQTIPADMRKFKNLTQEAGFVIMGRLTFESIGSKPLPKRNNIVLTRKKLRPEGVWIASSLENALLMAKAHDAEEVMIIGGESVYKEALATIKLSAIYVTRIKKKFEGDVFFPKINGEYRKIGSEAIFKGKDSPYNIVFEKYEERYERKN